MWNWIYIISWWWKIYETERPDQHGNNMRGTNIQTDTEKVWPSITWKEFMIIKPRERKNTKQGHKAKGPHRKTPSINNRMALVIMYGIQHDTITTNWCAPCGRDSGYHTSTLCHTVFHLTIPKRWQRNVWILYSYSLTGEYQIFSSFFIIRVRDSVMLYIFTRWNIFYIYVFVYSFLGLKLKVEGDSEAEDEW